MNNEQTHFVADDNSLVEVYLEFILTHSNYIIDILGKHEEHDNLWVYHVADVERNRYGCITTDIVKWGDKRIKKPMTRYKKSILFYTTNTDSEAFDEVSEEEFRLHFSFDKCEKKLV